MIGYVKGILEESRPGKIVVDVNGLGLNVIVADSTREELPAIGNEVKIYTYMSVREDGMSLYGFLGRDTLDLFNLLIGVSGVGPKGAQALLGAYSVSQIKYFIISEDVKEISKAPTIGKKTAERIIVDLKDKINKEEIGILTDAIVQSTKKLSSEAEDAIAALVALGYDKKTANDAVLKVENLDELDSNEILKKALPFMF